MLTPPTAIHMPPKHMHAVTITLPDTGTSMYTSPQAQVFPHRHTPSPHTCTHVYTHIHDSPCKACLPRKKGQMPLKLLFLSYSTPPHPGHSSPHQPCFPTPNHPQESVGNPEGSGLVLTPLESLERISPAQAILTLTRSLPCSHVPHSGLLPWAAWRDVASLATLVLCSPGTPWCCQLW